LPKFEEDMVQNKEGLSKIGMKVNWCGQIGKTLEPKYNQRASIYAIHHAQKI